MTDITDSDLPSSPWQTMRVFEVNEALRLVKAANLLYLGVRLSNRWEPSGEDERIMVWTLQIALEVPPDLEGSPKGG